MTTPEQALAAALYKTYRTSIDSPEDDGNWRSDAEYLLAALSGYTLVSDAELERLRELSEAALPDGWWEVESGDLEPENLDDIRAVLADAVRSRREIVAAKGAASEEETWR